MSPCYSVSLQEETYILLHYLSRLNNSLSYKLEKEKPIRLAEKNNSAEHLIQYLIHYFKCLIHCFNSLF